MEINHQDSTGSSYLHYITRVSQDQSTEVEQLLIQHKINVNLLDNYGRSPIFYLFIKEYKGEVIRLQ